MTPHVIYLLHVILFVAVAVSTCIFLFIDQGMFVLGFIASVMVYWRTRGLVNG